MYVYRNFCRILLGIEIWNECITFELCSILMVIHRQISSSANRPFTLSLHFVNELLDSENHSFISEAPAYPQLKRALISNKNFNIKITFVQSKIRIYQLKIYVMLWTFLCLTACASKHKTK